MGNILDGNKIEKLLWENGLDYEQSGPESICFLHVYSGAVKIVVADGYVTAEGWQMDAEDIGLEIWRDGELIDENTDTFEDEESLVQKILTYAE